MLSRMIVPVEQLMVRVSTRKVEIYLMKYLLTVDQSGHRITREGILCPLMFFILQVQEALNVLHTHIPVLEAKFNSHHPEKLPLN